jgi:hypothetical protein
MPCPRIGRPGDPGSILDRDEGLFLYPVYPNRLWGPPSLLYNGYRWVLFPGLNRGRGVTLTTHPHLLSRSWMSRSSSPPCSSIGVLWDSFCFTRPAVSMLCPHSHITDRSGLVTHGTPSLRHCRCSAPKNRSSCQRTGDFKADEMHWTCSAKDSTANLLGCCVVFQLLRHQVSHSDNGYYYVP